jgi:hypothetical protein
MAAAKGKATIAAEVSAALKAELEKRAKAEARSMSEVIGLAVRFYLDYAKVVRKDEYRPVPKEPPNVPG